MQIFGEVKEPRCVPMLLAVVTKSSELVLRKTALTALQLPLDSQLLVFSRTSLQGKRISEQNPRALFFNDRVALGWVRGGDVLEVAAHDETAGVVFYTLDQRADAAPRRST